MRSIPFTTVDVFTARQFAGNPLAVITDARELRDNEMRQIATEFNFSETTFVLPPRDSGNTAHVRIFTPTAEIPFAGHPNVGTGFVLARQGTHFGRPVGNALRFEERAGLVEVEVLTDEARVTGAKIRAPRPLDVFGDIDLATVAACARIPESAIVASRHQPVHASVGLPFAFAELDTLETLKAAQPSTDAFTTANQRYKRVEDKFALFIYVRKSGNPLHLRARMFAPLDNVPEDPATGSASAALGAFLTKIDPAIDLDAVIHIDQGVEMGRPSRIDLNMKKRNGEVTSVHVSGQCTIVTHGSIELPD